MTGRLELDRADVNWQLSVNHADLPAQAVAADKTTYRSLLVDSAEVEFSAGFTDLHTDIYRAILAGRGFTAADARPSIELAYRIRTAPVTRADAPEPPDAEPLEANL